MTDAEREVIGQARLVVDLLGGSMATGWKLDGVPLSDAAAHELLSLNGYVNDVRAEEAQLAEKTLLVPVGQPVARVMVEMIDMARRTDAFDDVGDLADEGLAALRKALA